MMYKYFKYLLLKMLYNHLYNYTINSSYIACFVTYVI